MSAVLGTIGGKNIQSKMKKNFLTTSRAVKSNIELNASKLIQLIHD